MADPENLFDGLKSNAFYIFRKYSGKIIVDFKVAIGVYYDNGVMGGISKNGAVCYGKNGVLIYPVSSIQF